MTLKSGYKRCPRSDLLFCSDVCPAQRVKVIAKKRVAKSDKACYPYEEGPLGDVMLKSAGDMGDGALAYSKCDCGLWF